MDQDQLIRDDFPLAQGEAGFDRASVRAHLTAAGAQMAALEARIAALEVEREALRRQLAAGDEDDADPVDDGAAETPDHGTAAAEPDADEVTARLAAVKLALQGADRETIRERLTAEYELADVDALLDDVLEQLA